MLLESPNFGQIETTPPEELFLCKTAEHRLAKAIDLGMFQVITREGSPIAVMKHQGKVCGIPFHRRRNETSWITLKEESGRSLLGELFDIGMGEVDIQHPVFHGTSWVELRPFYPHRLTGPLAALDDPMPDILRLAKNRQQLPEIISCSDGSYSRADYRIRKKEEFALIPDISD